jgi:hypothetical protein
VRCVFANNAIHVVFCHPFGQYKHRSDTAVGLVDCAI